MSDELIIAVMSTVVGVSSSLLPIAISWIHKRSAKWKQDETLNAANKQIEFLNLWLTTQKSISDNDEEIREIHAEMSKELANIKNRVTKSFVEIPTHTYTPWKQRSRFTKAFLFYAPPDSISWVLHTIYYICWSLLILLVISGISTAISSSDDLFTRIFITPLATLIGYLIVLWPIIPIMVIVRIVAVNREKASEKKRPDLQIGLAQPT